LGWLLCCGGHRALLWLVTGGWRLVGTGQWALPACCCALPGQGAAETTWLLVLVLVSFFPLPISAHIHHPARIPLFGWRLLADDAFQALCIH
jgi:hypothetical protein